tara:strand:+ start:65 stop:349 length:285 start_codon:yes stop_codon:yes gene_type:complete
MNRYKSRYKVDILRHGQEWTLEVEVTSWGRPAKRYGVPLIERHPEEPPEFDILSATCEDGEVSDDPDTIADLQWDVILEDVLDQRQQELEDYRV